MLICVFICNTYGCSLIPQKKKYVALWYFGGGGGGGGGCMSFIYCCAVLCTLHKAGHILFTNKAAVICYRMWCILEQMSGIMLIYRVILFLAFDLLPLKSILRDHDVELFIIWAYWSFVITMQLSSRFKLSGMHFRARNHSKFLSMYALPVYRIQKCMT